jgi:RNA polymerase sigma-70 factor, ECF subfamily
MVAMDEAMEKLIAARIEAGDFAGAATAALEGMGPQILGYLGATLRDETAAYEVFSFFCEQLWKSIQTFKGASSFKTWSYKLVMHSVSRYRRDGFRRFGRQLGSGEASALADQIRSRTAPYQQTEIKDKFSKLRESLEPDEQTLLFLRVDQQLSWNDVAEVMSEEGAPVEVSALRKRFERAKQRLRKLAEEHGLIDANSTE